MEFGGREPSVVGHALDALSTALDHLVKVVEDGGLDGYDGAGLLGFARSFEQVRRRTGLVDHRLVRDLETRRHVADLAVLGSIEYAVTVLNVPLIVVLGHDSCGAVKATLTALDEGTMPSGYVRDIVERVTPSILMGRHAGLSRVDEFEARHVSETVTQLRARSAPIAQRIIEGTLAIVGLTYHLADGRVVLREHLGRHRQHPSAPATRVQVATRRAGSDD